MLAGAKTIGRRILEHREALGLTQEALAARIDSYQATVWKLEAGLHPPTLYTAAKLAAVFGITIDELVLENEIDCTAIRPADNRIGARR